MSASNAIVRLSLTAIVAAGLAYARPTLAATPTLFGNPNGIRTDDQEIPLRLDDLALDVVALGDLAEVTVDATFGHNDEGVSEGIFEMQLPVGAVVTGYALDIDGEMIDGVLVRQAKARVSFEERVRERIDPGLAEISRANVFTTRVYPVSDDGRRIRLSFVAPFDSARTFTLPLESAMPVAAARIRVRAVGAPPRVTLPDGFEGATRTTDDGLEIESARRGAALTGSLIVTAATPTETLIASRGSDGVNYFQLRAEPFAAPTSRAAPRVRVYWDVSRSRLGQDLAHEVELLNALLARLRAETVDLVAFNSSGVVTLAAQDPESVARAIDGLTYRGATSFAVLDNARLPRADRCLLFSDGIVTIDARTSLPRGCRADAIATSADADLAYLTRITAETGGGAWSLAHERADYIVNAIAIAAPRPVAARDQTGKALELAGLPGGLLVGQAPAIGMLIVTYSDSRGLEREARYRSATRTAPFAGTGALWAAARVAELDSRDGFGEEAEYLARRHSVATPKLSFLVLETPDDYVEEGIAPPRTYPDELRLEYDELKVEHDEERAERERDHFEVIVSQWRELRTWWNGGPEPELEGSYREPRIGLGAGFGGFSGGGGGGGDAVGGALEEIVVTGSRIVEPSGSISIEIEPWASDRPYIAALESAPINQIETVFEGEERHHGDLPAFYIDVAHWLETTGQRSSAVEMLLSALDLPTADEATRKTVADLLLEWGQNERALALYSKLRAEDEDRPQPLRWLAMALARTGEPADTARAIELLIELALTPWDAADDGIAMISLLDANALLSRLAPDARAALRVDPRLVGALYFDLRVTLEWNTAATDMDLWITEPTDELVYYDNNASEIGGRLSNDMTYGYGPEEYLLRRAPEGTYEIAVDSFAADSLNPNGATVVTARLVRDFGRRTQKEEALQIELAPDPEGEDENEHLIGRFVVAR